MQLRYDQGVHLGPLSIDPGRFARLAFWTHRPARRPAAMRLLSSQGLAKNWSGVTGLPVGLGAVAAGQRVELLSTGYGLGGVALLSTHQGRRTLVVGPTTLMLQPRLAHRLVLYAPKPAQAPQDWIEHAQSAEDSLRLVVPDDAAALAVCDQLDAAGVAYRAPRWLGRPSSSKASVLVTTRGSGLFVDLRPRMPIDWQVDFARAVEPEVVFVHGPWSEPLVEALAVAGLATRILYRPKQLLLGDDLADE